MLPVSFLSNQSHECLLWGYPGHGEMVAGALWRSFHTRGSVGHCALLVSRGAFQNHLGLCWRTVPYHVGPLLLELRMVATKILHYSHSFPFLFFVSDQQLWTGSSVIVIFLGATLHDETIEPVGSSWDFGSSSGHTLSWYCPNADVARGILNSPPIHIPRSLAERHLNFRQIADRNVWGLFEN